MKSWVGIGATVLAASCFASSAFASEWWYIAMDNEKSNSTIAYVDRASIRPRGSIRQVWVTLVYERGTLDGAKSVLYNDEFNCDTREWRILSYVARGPNGQTLKSEKNYSRPGWDAIAPDSMAEAQLQFICNGSSGLSVKALGNDPLASAAATFAAKSRR